MSNDEQSIAIVGMALRFPQANTVEEFWHNLVSSKDCAKTLSQSEVVKLGADRVRVQEEEYVFRSYEIENIDMFDSEFFSFTPRETRLSDPQLRMLLEVAYESMENSGHNLIGEKVGVYVGAADHKYWLYHQLFDSEHESEQEIAKRIFVAKDYFATQLSYKLNFTGPSMMVSSACSSALLAVHEACNHLLMFDCEFAIAGGCEIVQGTGYLYSEGGLLSKDGYVRAFDQNASGTVFGSGVGAVVLRRLDDALTDVDHIYAILRSTAVNNDGHQKAGFTAPSMQGQMDVIREALIRAGISADDVSYVETHGTGTKVGDPIEIEALSRVYREFDVGQQYCAIGSVKTNVGHLSFAAGIAGLIKTALMLYHRKMVPSIHFEKSNPAIRFEETPFYLNTLLRKWASRNDRRLAGLSAFGVGGTNVHAILEEPPSRNQIKEYTQQSEIILLTAKTKTALDIQADNLSKYLSGYPNTPVSDISFTLALGRPHYKFRKYLVVTNSFNLTEDLREKPRWISKNDREFVAAENIVFMFPNKSSFSLEFGRFAYQRYKKFRASVNECLGHLLDDHTIDMKYQFEKDGGIDTKVNSLDLQISHFVISYSLVKQLMAWGIKPSLMVGQGVGEIIAATVANVFCLGNVIDLLIKKYRMVQRINDVSTFSAKLSEREIDRYTGNNISVVEGPDSVLVSTSIANVNQSKGHFVDREVLHGSHSNAAKIQSDLLKEEIQNIKIIIEKMELRSPEISFLSSFSGDLITATEAKDPKYWFQHFNQLVDCGQVTNTVSRMGDSVIIEIGSESLSATTESNEINADRVCISTIEDSRFQVLEYDPILEALGQLWVSHINPNWKAYFEDRRGTRIPLPTYPFQRRSFWLKPITGKNDITKYNLEDRDNEVSTALGGCIVSSEGTRVFEKKINDDNISYIVDHSLIDTPIFPGACFVQMALEAGGDWFVGKRKIVESISFKKALVLPKGTNRILQTIVHKRNDSVRFEIISLARKFEVSNENQMQEAVSHVEGELKVLGNDEEKKSFHFDFPLDASNQLDPNEYYHANKLIQYGPLFKAIKQLWQYDSCTVGWVELPEPLRRDDHGSSFHPVLLDACFQIMDVQSQKPSTGTIPIGLRNFVLYESVPNQFYVIAQSHDDSDIKSCVGDITLVSESGSLIAKIDHYLQEEIQDTSDLRDSIRELQYKIIWREFNTVSADSKIDIKDCLIISEENAMIMSISEKLQSRGIDVHFEDLRWNGFDPKTGLKAIEILDSVGLIVFCAYSEYVPSAESRCLALISLIKQVVGSKKSNLPKLVILTKGAQSVFSDDINDESSVHQSSLWGLGNTIVAEYPELRCCRIDIDGSSESISTLTEQLILSHTENQFVCRSSQLFVPRLTPLSDDNRDAVNIPNGPYEIKISEYGTFDNFIAAELDISTLLPDEIHIDMQIAALNFKETLYVLNFLNPEKIPAKNRRFGIEGAGIIKRVGTNVSQLKKGDRVVVWEPGCLRSDLIIDAKQVSLIPECANFETAASLPTVAMTSYYGLYCLAKIRPQEKILIHACAGGVGQVALQIAKRIGAEVFATASPGKWSYLKSQGVDHIFNSRSVDFCNQIKKATKGRGVDIVLNSLAGEYISKSFDVLANGGRFIEIGKKDIWTEARAKEYRQDVKYYFFELGEDRVSGSIGDTSALGGLMSDVFSDFSNGSLKPVATKKFLAQDISKAFRYLAAGKNIGKVLIDLKSEAKTRFTCEANRSYLITGGLGGLGMLCAEWLISKGAGRVILTSRSDLTPDKKKKIDKIDKDNTRITVEKCDVSNYSEVESIFQSIKHSGKDLAGIIHCAGVLEDSTIPNLNQEKIRHSFEPKIDGSWNLHLLSRDLELDWFILYSSVSAIFDGGGQGNYAAANAFMDGLAHFRSNMGLPCLSVNWGGWADVGMAAQLTSTRSQYKSELLNIKEAFISLENMLSANISQGIVCELGSRLRTDNALPIFYDIQTTLESEKEKVTELKLISRQHPKNTMLKNIQLFVKKQVLKVIGEDPTSDIGLDQDFMDLGVDSLSMTELKNSIQSGLGKDVNVASLLTNSTIRRLSDYINDNVILLEEDTEATGPSKDNNSEGARKPKVVDDSENVEFVQFSKCASNKNMICIPGIGGNVFDFAEFAKHSSKQYTSHVTKFNLSDSILNMDIRSLASSIKKNLHKVQTAAPYSIVGYSFGGVIALELAYQLSAAGEEVEFVMLIDTFPHFVMQENPDFQKYIEALSIDTVLSLLNIQGDEYRSMCEALLHCKETERNKIIDKMFNKYGRRNQGEIEVIKGLLSSSRGKSKYEYKPLSSDIGVPLQFVESCKHPKSVGFAELKEFINSNEISETCYGWGNLVSEKLISTRVNANHNELLQTPHLEKILAIINENLKYK